MWSSLVEFQEQYLNCASSCLNPLLTSSSSSVLIFCIILILVLTPSKAWTPSPHPCQMKICLDRTRTTIVNSLSPSALSFYWSAWKGFCHFHNKYNITFPSLLILSFESKLKPSKSTSVTFLSSPSTSRHSPAPNHLTAQRSLTTTASPKSLSFSTHFALPLCLHHLLQI